jgi:hypothetical protein
VIRAHSTAIESDSDWSAMGCTLDSLRWSHFLRRAGHPGSSPTGVKLSRCAAGLGTLPPGAGGPWRGVAPAGTEVPNLTAPNPNPSPPRGGKKSAAPSHLNSAPAGSNPRAGLGGRSISAAGRSPIIGPRR